MLTELDLIVDFQSINPGKQLFGKIVSGMYLGEINITILLIYVMLFHIDLLLLQQLVWLPSLIKLMGKKVIFMLIKIYFNYIECSLTMLKKF
ncbi:hypothetical protein HZS_2083 [Henneguya salminicola]|nr:hypothetical protein HZS_2083 [Henneguya salminicola]